MTTLQVRRPSGRPQGILNIGVALLDSSMRSMPLYRQLSMSAVGFRDLMEDTSTLPHLQQNNNNQTSNNGIPVLRRSKSERSELVGLDHISPSSSIVAVKPKPDAKESSILSISMVPFAGMKRVGKASSVISGAELREKPKQKGKKGKAGSVLSDSIVSKESSSFRKGDVKTASKNDEHPGQQDEATKKVVDEKSVTKTMDVPSKEKLPSATVGKPVPKYDYGGPKGSKYMMGIPAKKGNSIWSDSEVGPSPSEVAAAMAERKYPLEDNQSSVLDGWSMDESVEGLRSKLERWRMELPPLYDRGGFSSSSYKSSVRHTRRHTESEAGLFSCFGNIFGYECQCICGKPPKKRSASARFHSPSTLTPGRSFL